MRDLFLVLAAVAFFLAAFGVEIFERASIGWLGLAFVAIALIVERRQLS